MPIEVPSVNIGGNPSENLPSLENRIRTITGVPPNLLLEAIESNTQIRITLDYRQNQITGLGFWRVYYLSALLVTAADIFAPVRIVTFPDGSFNFTGFFDLLQGKQSWVIDIPNSGKTVSISVPAAPYTNGGWFYAVGVDTSGEESSYFSTSPVSIPASIVTGPGIGPLVDVTSPSVVLTHKTEFGEFLDTVACTYTAPAPSPITPLYGFAGVMIVIFNNFDAGNYEEVAFFQYKGEGPGASVTFSFNILRDDGSNPGPAPGAHNVTIYFLAVDRIGGRIAQAITASPSVVLVGGFN